MAYVPGNLSTDADLLKVLGLHFVELNQPSDTETIHYEATCNFTGINYLRFTTKMTAEAAAANSHVKCYIDGVEKADHDILQGSTERNTTKIDCTSLSGDLVLKITMQGGDVAKYVRGSIDIMSQES